MVPHYAFVAVMLSCAALFATAVSAADLPPGLAVRLLPSGLPAAGAITNWPNAVAKGPAGAVLDNTQCYDGSSQSCASAPSVTAGLGGGVRAATFTSPGLVGLGNNLVLTLDAKAPVANFSVFYLGRVREGRLLASRTANWLLGSWSPQAGVTYVDRAYADYAAGDDGWMAQGIKPANNTWAVYGMTISTADGGCAWNGAALIGCNTQAVAPGDIRLGGGIGSVAGFEPTEFGSGDIVEVLVWPSALGAADVWAVWQYFLAAYPALLAA